MKKIISLIICFVMCLSFAACGKNDYIGIDKAKQTVVDDIGAALNDVEFAVNDLVTDSNGDYYKLHFTKDGTEYVYKVDAMTGKIIDKTTQSNDNDDNSDSTANTTATEGLLDNKDSGENNSNGNNNGNNNSNTDNNMSSTSDNSIMD